MVSSQQDIEYEYHALLKELKSYRKDLLDKPRLLAVTKMDLQEDYQLDQEINIDIPIIEISAATGYHIDTLKEAIWGQLQHAKTIRTKTEGPS
jgi:GTP-binding protein